MKTNEEFYVSYIEGSLGNKTKRDLKRFVGISIAIVLIAVLIFSLSQKPFKNGSFELATSTKITGTFHEDPYPMLRVQVAEHEYKNILLLGFGKSSANPYLERLEEEVHDLNGKLLTIEGNLIYYNGKTLIQITSDEKVTLAKGQKIEPSKKEIVSDMTLQGEIIDPKCYFGVMKPGYGKIHRSCAARCISGGIPPVLATTDNNTMAQYFLLTDLNGQPINDAILQFIGKPSKIKGTVEKMEDWYILKIDTKNISIQSEKSEIY